MNNLKNSNQVTVGREYYVYVLLDPDTNQLTYVGKGKGNRVKAHKDQLKLILAYDMTEEEAFSLEAALIALFKSGQISGLPDLKNKISGQLAKSMYKIGPCQVSEMERDITKGDSLLVLNVSGSYNEDNLINAVQYDWHLQPERANNVDYILAESNGEIVGVFKAGPGGWAPVKNNPDRYYIVNPIEVDDPQVIQKYIRNKDFARKRGEANPVRYFIY